MSNFIGYLLQQNSPQNCYDMRKLILFLLVIGFVFACNNNTTTETKKETTKDSTTKDTSNPNAPAATNAQY